jgi:hypothetical protein
VFVPGWPFQPGLMFVGKTRSLPESGTLEDCLTRPGGPFRSSLIFVSKTGAYPNEAQLRCSTLCRLLALPTNIKLAWKLAYFKFLSITTVKKFLLHFDQETEAKLLQRLDIVQVQALGTGEGGPADEGLMPAS